jgi:hypothetical protein
MRWGSHQIGLVSSKEEEVILEFFLDARAQQKGHCASSQEENHHQKPNPGGP